MPAPEPQFIEIVRRHLKYLTSAGPFDPDKSLKSLGLDSMAAIDLMLDIEDTYGITLPDKYLTEETFATADALWRAVSELRGEAVSH